MTPGTFRVRFLFKSTSCVIMRQCCRPAGKKSHVELQYFVSKFKTQTVKNRWKCTNILCVHKRGFKGFNSAYFKMQKRDYAILSYYSGDMSLKILPEMPTFVEIQPFFKHVKKILQASSAFDVAKFSVSVPNSLFCIII